MRAVERGPRSLWRVVLWTETLESFGDLGLSGGASPEDLGCGREGSGETDVPLSFCLRALSGGRGALTKDSGHLALPSSPSRFP